MTLEIPRVSIPEPTAADWHVLSQLYRLQAARFDVLDAGGCEFTDGRMHKARSIVSILYNSLAIQGCVEEIVGNWVIKYGGMYASLRAQGKTHNYSTQEVLGEFAAADLPMGLWTLGGAGSRLLLLDLADRAVLARIGIAPADLIQRFDSQTGDSDDRLTVEIGRQAYEQGWDGILIPSVVPGEVNVNLCLGGINANGRRRPDVWPGTRVVSKVDSIDPADIGADFRSGFAAAARRALVF